jgi:Ser/Thr protein kinase RdoA (MazF antagonist)
MADNGNSFFQLSPDKVLQAIESRGFLTTGEFYQLNSYENRVFDVVLEETPNFLTNNHVIAKFYRPGKWSAQALKEEHDFLEELKSEHISVVAPLRINGSTLHLIDGMYMCLYEKTLGRMPQEFINRELEQVGRLLAQLHNVGAQRRFTSRPTLLTPSHLGWQALSILRTWVTPEVWPRYQEAGQRILDYLEDSLDPSLFTRIHGDCHKGNLLSNGLNFFFVDFDDSINGPAVQDFWMLLSGDAEESEKELAQILRGYEELRDFDDNELDLIPALRGLRILSYAAWIAARWQDPSFPRLFPNFNSYVYWAEEVEALEKIAWSL